MENINQEFLAWLAGFWEGEGSLEASDKHSRISIAQTDPTPLHFIQRKIGSGQVRISEWRRKPHYKDKWIWEINRRPDIIKVVILIIPYLKFRRKKVVDKLFILQRKEARFPYKPRYTKEENEYLVKNWAILQPKTIAIALGKTSAGVRSRVKKLGLISPRKRGGQLKQSTNSPASQSTAKGFQSSGKSEG